MCIRALPAPCDAAIRVGLSTAGIRSTLGHRRRGRFGKSTKPCQCTVSGNSDGRSSWSNSAKPLNSAKLLTPLPKGGASLQGDRLSSKSHRSPPLAQDHVMSTLSEVLHKGDGVASYTE
jgi:hypothetical protein